MRRAGSLQPIEGRFSGDIGRTGGARCVSQAPRAPLLPEYPWEGDALGAGAVARVRGELPPGRSTRRVAAWAECRSGGTAARVRVPGRRCAARAIAAAQAHRAAVSTAGRATARRAGLGPRPTGGRGARTTLGPTAEPSRRAPAAAAPGSRRRPVPGRRSGVRATTAEPEPACAAVQAVPAVLARRCRGGRCRPGARSRSPSGTWPRGPAVAERRAGVRPSLPAQADAHSSPGRPALPSPNRSAVRPGPVAPPPSPRRPGQ